MIFSVITPTYNSSKHLTETIESVLNQKGNFEIEYILVDGGSSDSTLDIVATYVEKAKSISNIKSLYVISEPDNGMYDAITKGFEIASGNVYCWINSDDIYQPDAFETVTRIFKEYPDVKWIKGITSYINENNEITSQGNYYRYSQELTNKGLYGRCLPFIQQDSTFWRSDLWCEIDLSYFRRLKLAGDYFLWINFSKKNYIYNIQKNLSSFRHRRGQLSSNIKDYHIECEKIKKCNKIVLILLKIAIRCNLKKFHFCQFFLKKYKYDVHEIIHENNSLINKKSIVSLNEII